VKTKPNRTCTSKAGVLQLDSIASDVVSRDLGKRPSAGALNATYERNPGFVIEGRSIKASAKRIEVIYRGFLV
jgi:hypothetical protein